MNQQLLVFLCGQLHRKLASRIGIEKLTGIKVPPVFITSFKIAALHLKCCMSTSCRSCSDNNNGEIIGQVIKFMQSAKLTSMTFHFHFIHVMRELLQKFLIDDVIKKHSI